MCWTVQLWRPVASQGCGPVSCIIQQNSEWLFFMGLFISFDHLFQVGSSFCYLPLPLPLTLSHSHSAYSVCFLFVLFIIFIQFPVACAWNDFDQRWRKNHQMATEESATSTCSRRQLEAAGDNWRQQRPGHHHVPGGMCIVYWTKNFPQPTFHESTNHTHICPAFSLQSPWSSQGHYAHQSNSESFTESSCGCGAFNASFDFILCPKSGQKNRKKKTKTKWKIKNKFYLFLCGRNWIKCSSNASRKGTFDIVSVSVSVIVTRPIEMVESRRYHR